MNNPHFDKSLTPDQRGPWRAKRDPKSYPTAHEALLPDKKQDWVYARAQYEAGIKSVALIAKEIGVGPTAVFARASNEGWVRDKNALAKVEIEIKATKEQESQQLLVLEKERAERVNAEMQAMTLVKHRTDIARARSLTMRLFKELEEMMDNLPELESLGDIMRQENDKGQDKLNDAYRKVLSLSDRVDINKKLSEALKTQLQLERQAFGIQGALEDPETPESTVPGQSDIDKILGKFDLVIKRKTSEKSSDARLGEVIDVSPAD